MRRRRPRSILREELPDGAGPAVILVSGGSVDRWSNAALADLLASDFTVYNYDRRGRGPSGDTPPYAVEREIEKRLSDPIQTAPSAGLGKARRINDAAGRYIENVLKSRKVFVVAMVGVPVMAPVLVLSVKPVGNVPEASVKVTAPMNTPMKTSAW